MNFSYGVAESLYRANMLANLEGTLPQAHHLLFAFSLRYCGATQALIQIGELDLDHLHVQLKRHITCQIEPIRPCARLMYNIRPEKRVSGCMFTAELSDCFDIADNYATRRCRANVLHTTHLLCAMTIQGHQQKTNAKCILDQFNITYDELDEYLVHKSVT
jgi:hypothetical protein